MTDTEETLLNLLKSIEDPTSDIIEPLVKLPTVDLCDDMEVKHNFVKNPAEIVNYLKKHYPEWNAYDNIKNKVVRTCGKDLNLLKLDKKVAADTENNVASRNADVTMNNADVTMRKADVTMINVPVNNALNASKNTESLKRVKITMNVGNVNYTGTEIKKNTEKVVQLPRPRSFRKIDTEKDRTNSPNIIRNMQIIDKFENILKRKRLNPDEYSESADDDITNATTNCNNNHTHTDSKHLSKENDSNHPNVKKRPKKCDSTDLKRECGDSKMERKSDKDDSTNDSGIGNDSPEIYSVVTKFSSKLSESLEKIRSFM